MKMHGMEYFIIIDTSSNSCSKYSVAATLNVNGL